MKPSDESVSSRTKPLLLVQLSLDPNLYPELVALLSALPVRSRAAKIRLMLEAYMSARSTRRQLESTETADRPTAASPKRPVMNSETSLPAEIPESAPEPEEIFATLGGYTPGGRL